MIIEKATLDVIPGQAAEFERAFAEAQTIIAAMPGYREHQLHRCIEQPDRYVLLVWWNRLEDHTEGFRQSAEYQRWRALLHKFYDPFPVVEHYRQVSGVLSGAQV
ncbi:antibiotic biosynthesis monooxygenase family protein [Gilvimarinus agarilyticus]|uniref:antibiotic biosynthesis monooxygenase family protein n=1 Tax=Gilvimarinus agarilyticus TaxID=679259 RepID=UPI0005A0631A|nr:antibiotic biosynthesis monooxygenase [Gilvimarinus agarilyticus]